MQRRSDAYQPPALKYEFVIGDRGRAFYAVKRAIDVGVAVSGLILLTPVMLLVALAVATTGRPIFFRQVRLGQGGRPFTLIKFRTMRPSASPYALKPKLAADDVTRVGRVLRLTGLDEIPQLWNVLLGQMSLVGPRPEMPFIVESYDWVQRLRLNARPGLTGLWQLSAVRLEPIHRHVEYDLFYLAHRSLLLDAWIMMRTPLVLFLHRYISLDRRLIDRWARLHPSSAEGSHRVVLDLSTPVATLADVAGAG